MHPQTLEISDTDLKRVINILEGHGMDISYYKKDFLRRRIKARMLVTRTDNVLNYCNLLKKDRNEARSLLDSAFINVSEFFRDPPLWREMLILLKNMSKGFTRIWSVACSCGEEPYSIAILVSEIAPIGYVRIIATDIDEFALKVATDGVYNIRSLKNVRPDLMKKYFLKQGNDLYKVSDRLKELIRFKKHDVIKEPALMHCDMILCRNLMIYFPREVQFRLIEKFWTALKPGGYLVIGMSEVLCEDELKYFEPYNLRLRIYKKRSFDIHENPISTDFPGRSFS